MPPKLLRDHNPYPPQSITHRSKPTKYRIKKIFKFKIFSHLPSDINLSRISQANMVGFSLLYCSIFETTVGVATFGLEPPIRPGGRSEPAMQTKRKTQNHHKMYTISLD